MLAQIRSVASSHRPPQSLFIRFECAIKNNDKYINEEDILDLTKSIPHGTPNHRSHGKHKHPLSICSCGIGDEHPPRCSILTQYNRSWCRIRQSLRRLPQLRLQLYPSLPPLLRVPSMIPFYQSMLRFAVSQRLFSKFFAARCSQMLASQTFTVPECTFFA